MLGLLCDQLKTRASITCFLGGSVGELAYWLVRSFVHNTLLFYLTHFAFLSLPKCIVSLFSSLHLPTITQHEEPCTRPFQSRARDAITSYVGWLVRLSPLAFSAFRSVFSVIASPALDFGTRVSSLVFNTIK